LLLTGGLLLIALSRDPGRLGVDPASTYVGSWRLAGIAALIAAASGFVPLPWLRAAVAGAGFATLWFSFTFDAGGTFLNISLQAAVLWMVPALIVIAVLAGRIDGRFPQGGMLAVWLIGGGCAAYAIWAAVIVIGLLVNPITF
jgi:hypothetical protein